MFSAPAQFPSCNLARVPTHAVLARPDAPVSDYQKVLSDADKMLGTGTNSSVKLYADGLLFSKDTVGLEIVQAAKQPYTKYLDTAYLQDVAQVEKCGLMTSKANGLEHSFKLMLFVLALYCLVV